MSPDERERPSWTERDKLSFSELDRRRKEGRSSGGGQPSNPAAKRREEEATKQYLAEIDQMFTAGTGGAEGKRLAAAMRDAHGTPGLADACRAYRDEVGIPDDASLLGLFLDSGDRDLVVAGLRALRALQGASSLSASGGLKSQLRLLAEDADDEVAEAAEEIVDGL